MNFTVNPLGPGAAEIIGLDCSLPMDAELFRKVRKTWLEYPVLTFRDQKMTAKQVGAFGRLFGQLEHYMTPFAGEKPPVAALRQTNDRETPDQMLYVSREDSDVLIMTNEVDPKEIPIAIVDNAEIWHSDASHKMEPYQAIMIYVLQNPASGGDTEFCDMRAVYDALTPEIKKALDGRQAIHHWSKVLNPRFTGTLDKEAQEEGERIAEMIPPMHQPLVRQHPETGRPSLYISPRFTLQIDDVDPAFSDTFLNTLFDFADSPEFHYRHAWRENDLMIWDNRCLNHRVRSYPVQEARRRYRVTVMGDAVFALRGTLV